MFTLNFMIVILMGTVYYDKMLGGELLTKNIIIKKKLIKIFSRRCPLCASPFPKCVIIIKLILFLSKSMII